MNMKVPGVHTAAVIIDKEIYLYKHIFGAGILHTLEELSIAGESWYGKSK